MPTMRFSTTACTLATVLMFAGACDAASVIWNGPDVMFSKGLGADPTDPANQDFLTPNVSITRADTQGIYNAAVETQYQNLGGGAGNSPAGTQWAVGTTDNLGSLTFESWFDTVGPTSSIGGPNNSVGVPLVLHLVDDDIYVDITFTQWGQGAGGGGSFAYTRSSPIPEPATVALSAIAGLVLIGFSRGLRQNS